jgi:hypothetical protein
MRHVPPFVTGYVVSAFLIGAGVGGSMNSVEAAAFGAGVLVAGALVGCLLCWWLLGFEAPWWQMMGLGLLANPAFLVPLGILLLDFDCVTGSKRGWDCFLAAFAIVIGSGALATPLGGLLWRWWKRRGLTPRSPSPSDP